MNFIFFDLSYCPFLLLYLKKKHPPSPTPCTFFPSFFFLPLIAFYGVLITSIYLSAASIVCSLYISFGYLISRTIYYLYKRETLPPANDLPSFLYALSQTRSFLYTYTHNTMPSRLPDNVCKALEIARESTDGYVEPKINDILEAAISDVRRRLEAQPDTYVLSRDEFALFNYYRRSKFNDSPLAQKIAQTATERFWNNYKQNSIA